MSLPLEAARHFLAGHDIAGLAPFGNGNVNDTFVVVPGSGEELILQRINPAVFPEPQRVQDNLALVARHLAEAVRNQPGLRERFIPLTVYEGKDGAGFHDPDGGVWRLVNRVPGQTHDTVTSPSQAWEIGRCLGLFHRLLTGMDPARLTDTLPGFHDTAGYLAQYDRAAANAGLDPESEFCRRFIEERRNLAFLLGKTPGLSRGVIHGDPKADNFVFDRDRAVSLIDLDTVRHGLLLHDIGDGLRSCCNPAGESAGPDEVRFDAGLFHAWIRGYLSEAELLLTAGDKAHIVQAVRVIAFELGLRFFTDHLEGDRYFKTRQPGHNLLRARVQFALVRSIEEQTKALQNVIEY